MASDWDTLARLAGVLIAVNGGLLWAVKWIIDQQRRAFEQRFLELVERANGQDGDVEALRQDLQDLKVRLPREYVHRDDWIMSFGRFEQKIDGIWGFLHELRDRIDKSGE